MWRFVNVAAISDTGLWLENEIIDDTTQTIPLALKNKEALADGRRATLYIRKKC